MDWHTTVTQNDGVLMDGCLPMQTQIIQLCKSVWLPLGQIGLIRNHFDETSIKRILSRLYYIQIGLQKWLIIWCSKDPAWQTAMHSKCNCTYEHITPVLKDLHWLPVHQRITRYSYLSFKKVLNNLVQAAYITELLEPLSHTRTLRSSNLNLLKCPKSNTSCSGDHSFSHAGPRLWNCLLFELVTFNNFRYSRYKSNAKIHLFKQEYGLTDVIY